MVAIEQIEDEIPTWKERLLDAEEIETAARSLTRPTAKMQLESVAKRIRKEGEALKRVEASKQQVSNESTKQAVEAQPKVDNAPKPAPVPTPPPVVSKTVKYVPIDRFAFDAGGSSDRFVTLYIDLPRVGTIPRDNIQCVFTKNSFDLVVNDLQSKNYRLFKDSLEKDLDTDQCKIVVKADKILVKLAKIKNDYGGFEYWTKLTDTKKKTTADTKKDDPQASIMGLMKQMYDEGDDSMKKMIGETMLKQRNGELGRDDPMKDMDDF